MFIPNTPDGFNKQVIGLATQVGAGATANSNTIRTQGLNNGSVGLTSDHAATLSVQRYVDAGGIIPLGVALTAALAANTPNSVAWVDGLPSGSIIVSVTNSAGAVANLTNITVNLAPVSSTNVSAVLTATALSANTNNYNPAGSANADVWNVSSTLAIDLTGAVGSTLNRTLTLRNIGSFPITLRDQSTSSAAANRFKFSVTNTDGALLDQVLEPGFALTLRGTVASGWVASAISQIFDIDATVNDAIIVKFRGVNSVVFDGSAIDGGSASQQFYLSSAQVLNTSDKNGNVGFVTSAAGSGASAVALFNATNNVATNFLHQVNSSNAPSILSPAPAGNVSWLLSEGAPLGWGTGPGGLISNAAFMDTAGNVTLKITASTTGQTNGFMYIPKVAGAPTGVPATLGGAFTNSLPICYDTANHKLWVYDGGWKGVAVA